jgi:hypothetical protein
MVARLSSRRLYGAACRERQCGAFSAISAFLTRLIGGFFAGLGRGFLPGHALSVTRIGLAIVLVGITTAHKASPDDCDAETPD